MYILGNRSKANLIGVHPDLRAVIEKAIQLTPIDFTVIEGVRTVEKQKKLFMLGASTTMNSRHLTGHAVDVAAWMDSAIRWDWPLYDQLSEAIKSASVRVGVPIDWGGDWSSFRDGPHFQLPWNSYPIKEESTR